MIVLDTRLKIFDVLKNLNFVHNFLRNSSTNLWNETIILTSRDKSYLSSCIDNRYFLNQYKKFRSPVYWQHLPEPAK